MEFYLEPWFWFLMMIVVMIISGIIRSNFTKSFKIYGAKPNASGKSGAQIAKELLLKNGIDYVNVVQGTVRLGDNFNPMKKTITLSPEVYGSASVAAEAIAAHEVGHAIQWNKAYIGIKIRDFLLPVGQVGSAVSGIALNIGFMLLLFSALFYTTIPAYIYIIILAGAVGLAGVALFQIVTLPVEFNASKRAKTALAAEGYAYDSDETVGINKMLNSAAMTYVVAVLQSLVYIMYLLMIVLSASRRR